MEMILVVFGVMALLVLVMSVGVIFARKPISGSCGGMSALGMDVACDVCKGDKNKCEKEKESAQQQAGEGASLGYDATKSRA